jgi:hypothetical protein
MLPQTGLQWAASAVSRARFGAAAYVEMLLRRLGFQAQQVQQIIDEIAYAPRGAADQNT